MNNEGLGIPKDHSERDDIDDLWDAMKIHKPGTSAGVFHGEFSEFFVHFPVEVGPKEEWPEPEQRVHFLTLTLAHLGSIWGGERVNNYTQQKFGIMDICKIHWTDLVIGQDPLPTNWFIVNSYASSR